MRSESVPEILSAACEHLRAGGVVAAATESSFGLLASVSHRTALDALFRLKPRDAGKGMGLIIPNVSSWRGLVRETPERALGLARAFWPGGLTIILEAAEGLEPRLCVDGTVGVRQPGPSAAADLVALFGNALTATSANLAGEPPCGSDRAVIRAFPDAHRSGELMVIPGQGASQPVSTLLRLKGRTHRVLRPGAVSEAKILEHFSSVDG